MSRYRTVGVRLPELFVERCRSLSLNEGWEFSDMMRVLLLIGAVPSLLHLRDAKQIELYDTKAALRLMATVLDKGGPRRPYDFRDSVPSTIVTLHLPRFVVELVMIYAEMSGNSRNKTYADFLYKGLIMYQMAENTLLKTSLSRRRGIGAGNG